MKKKIIIILTIALTIVGLIYVIKKVQESNQKTETNSYEPLPLKVEDIPLDITVAQEGESFILNASCTNKSKYNISNLTLYARLKDSGENIEIKFDGNIDSKSSLVAKAKGPNSGKVEDVEILKYKVSLKEGIYLEYDAQLRQYNWS